jgi:transposase InsO family protein/transposase-like protein
MAVRVIPMQVKLAVALARFGQGERLDVRATCRELGVSPPTFYKYAKRFAESGLDGLFERSRRPCSSPRQTPSAVEDRIVCWRKELVEQGWDAGAQSIFYRMRRAGESPPSTRTIHRVLVRRGLVTPAPGKRPRSSFRSFAFARTNECWQTDATECVLADGGKATVFHLLDDCSRLALRSLAAAAETTTAAWLCLSEAMTRFGVPAMVLSDNGWAFTAKRHGGQTAFELNLRALGVNVVTSAPYHPQTCGKTERYHQTFKRWLDAHHPPENIEALQTLADTFDTLYNTQRPHASLAGATPEEIWQTTQRCPPPTAPADPTTRTSTVTVSRTGIVPAGRYYVIVGRRWEGATVTVITTGDHVSIFHGKHLVRALTIDPAVRYQPLGTPRGGRRQPRIVSTKS